MHSGLVIFGSCCTVILVSIFKGRTKEMEWFPVTVRAHAYAACKVNVLRIIPSCNFYVKMVFTDFLLSWYNWRSLDSRDGDAIFYSQSTFVDTSVVAPKATALGARVTWNKKAEETCNIENCHPSPVKVERSCDLWFSSKQPTRHLFV